METPVYRKKSQKYQALFQVTVLAVIIVLLNILSSQFFSRIDLTSDKRYTLSDSTRQMLRQLNDKVFVKVLLTGDMPAGFKRLSTSTQELLNEMKAYAGSNIQYEFEDPLTGRSSEEKNRIYKEMSEKGLQPTNVQSVGGDEYSEKIIIPAALVYYQGKEAPVNLLVNENGIASQEALNISVSQLENNLASAIQQLTIIRKPKIAFLYGQDELKSYYLADILQPLFNFYEVDTLNLSQVVSVKENIGLIVVAKPVTAFDEKDKFKLDQYIMRGGKILWLLDALNADLDSLTHKPTMLAVDLPLNLEDQLFTYGVRMNPVLLLDLQCNPVPLLVNNPGGNQPEFRLFPCYYFPVLIPDADNIITKNIDAVSTMFPSTIDTINVSGIKKTILLHSSKYSKIAFTPWQIDFRELKNAPQQETFNKRYQPVAVLLEGKFSSVYKNRLAQGMITVMNDSLGQPFLEQSSTPTKMIVIADGDIIKNDFSKGRPSSLGYYKYTGEFFNNKNFLLNCIDYLSGHLNRIETRSKTVQLRLLDMQRIKKEKLQWQLINLLTPVGIILFFGLIFTLVKSRKYSGR